MDFVFGKLINDELKLTYHRASRNGVQHLHRITPADPTPEDDVTAHVVTSGDVRIQRLSLCYTTDGSVPLVGSACAVDFELVSTEWDTLVWDYLCHWEAIIPAQPDQCTVNYAICAWSDQGEEIYADYPNVEERLRHATMRFFGSLPEDSIYEPEEHRAASVFTYHVDRQVAPEWGQDAIIYQIFLDRFHPGKGRDWLQTGDLSSFCGGTLWGVRDKLDYLAALGINCLWLSPTWKSPSCHGYDISDYTRVEPRLGGEEALRAVVEGAHDRGIRVLLDLVCNHVSNQLPFFHAAQRDRDSQYRDWFDFDQRYTHGYRCFFNVETMPELNLEHPAARDWMIDNAVRCLSDFDVDGFRLDYANGAGPNFWSVFRPRVKAAKADCLLLGEIIDAPDRLRLYQGRLDGCLDFPLNDALRKTFAWKTWSEARFYSFVDDHGRYFEGDFIMPSFLDNHDMDRFSFVAKDDVDPLKRAVAAQMRLPNPPIIFYGAEVGLQQAESTREITLDVSRVPMVWDDGQDRDLLAYYRERIQDRKNRRSWH